jgi:hypothetical protein
MLQASTIPLLQCLETPQHAGGLNLSDNKPRQINSQLINRCPTNEPYSSYKTLARLSWGRRWAWRQRTRIGSCISTHKMETIKTQRRTIFRTEPGVNPQFIAMIISSFQYISHPFLTGTRKQRQQGGREKNVGRELPKLWRQLLYIAPKSLPSGWHLCGYLYPRVSSWSLLHADADIRINDDLATENSVYPLKFLWPSCELSSLGEHNVATHGPWHAEDHIS